MTLSKRVAYADWVRVIAAAMVVMIHTTIAVIPTAAVTSVDFAVATVLDALAHAAVPLFVMVSGVFFLDEARELPIRRAVTRYALPLVGLYFFWSLVYALANKIVEPVVLGGAPLSGALLGEFATAVVQGAYHLWYLPMLATVYLMAPLLRRFVSRDNPRPAVYFLLVVGVLNFLLPTGIDVLKQFTGLDFGTTYASFWPLSGLVYVAYFVAGWLIANARPAARRQRVAVYVAGTVSAAVMVALTLAASIKAGRVVASLMEPANLFCAVYALALFALFAWEGRDWQPRRRLVGLSGLTFGVYVVHVEVQSLYKVFWPYVAAGDGTAFGYIMAQWGIVIVVSLAAAWVLSRIPLLKKSVRG